MTKGSSSVVRILLLEDESFIRDTIRLMLRAFDNVELEACGDGTQGLTLLGNGFSPDVILCDVQMAPMDGLTFLRRLRTMQDNDQCPVPVIMLTAASDAGTVRAASELGICNYLVKPVSLTKLTERLDAALRAEPPEGKSLNRAVTKIQHRL